MTSETQHRKFGSDIVKEGMVAAANHLVLSLVMENTPRPQAVKQVTDFLHALADVIQEDETNGGTPDAKET